MMRDAFDQLRGQVQQRIALNAGKIDQPGSFWEFIKSPPRESRPMPPGYRPRPTGKGMYPGGPPPRADSTSPPHNGPTLSDDQTYRRKAQDWRERYDAAPPPEPVSRWKVLTTPPPEGRTGIPPR